MFPNQKKNLHNLKNIYIVLSLLLSGLLVITQFVKQLQNSNSTHRKKFAYFDKQLWK